MSEPVDDAADAISTTLDRTNCIVDLTIGPSFDKSIYHPENVAERALVRALVAGVAALAGEQSADFDSLTSEIVPDAQARHAHMFQARQFRDYMRDLLDHEPVVISHFDDAAAKLGLGWRVRNPNDGGRIEGKSNCLDFLNTLVRDLEDDLCKSLRSFRRSILLSKLLLNFELASASRERWHRTAAAVLALRDDKAAALKVMRDHEFKLNGVFQSSRNLMEMVICESSMDHGEEAGALDLSRLMTKASQLFHIGGWSDLVRWDLLEPVIVVRPLGDVHAKHDLVDAVIEGFSSATSDDRYRESARSYAKNLEPPEVFPESSDEIDSEFLAAWQEEFGVELDSYRRFLDAAENLAIERREVVLELHRSKLVALAETSEIGFRIVESMNLVPRASWRQLPDGHDFKDIAPWRFRRRLSVLRRPLLQLTLDEDPPMLVAPGLLREAFAYMVRSYYHASYPDRHLGSAMRRYAGHARRRDGMKFNREVADRMVELGWQSQPEVAVTKILGQALDRNYGDVDVLAWDVPSGRILVMECKDLQFRKTYGEIAEQLNDFRGQLSPDGKTRDLLRKHMDRVDVLRAHIPRAKRYLGITSDCAIESHLVFRNPVPMQFAVSDIRKHASLHTLAELHSFKLA